MALLTTSDADGVPLFFIDPRALARVTWFWALPGLLGPTATLYALASWWRRKEARQPACPACGRTPASEWAEKEGYCNRCGAVIVSDPASFEDYGVPTSSTETVTLTGWETREALRAYAPTLARFDRKAAFAILLFIIYVAGVVAWRCIFARGSDTTTEEDGGEVMNIVLFAVGAAWFLGMVFACISRMKHCPQCECAWDNKDVLQTAETGRCPRCRRVATLDGPWPERVEPLPLAEWKRRFVAYRNSAVRWRWTDLGVISLFIVPVLGMVAFISLEQKLGLPHPARENWPFTLAVILFLFSGFLLTFASVAAKMRRASAARMEHGLDCPWCGADLGQRAAEPHSPGGVRFRRDGICPVCLRLLVDKGRDDCFPRIPARRSL